MNISTIPATGSAMEARSRSIGALTWVMATRNTRTTTNLEKISASTKLAHLENHPLVTSQPAPARAIGPRTTRIRISALRTRRLNQTIAAAVIARKARKMMMIAAAPGAVIWIAVSPAMRAAILPPISSRVVPVAWMIPMHSWSTISSRVAVIVTRMNAPSTLLAIPVAARPSAPGSRRMRLPMSCRQKNAKVIRTARPNTTLYTSR